MPEFRGHPQGGGTVTVNEVEVCTPFDQQAYNPEMPGLRGHHQGGLSYYMPAYLPHR